MRAYYPTFAPAPAKCELAAGAFVTSGNELCVPDGYCFRGIVSRSDLLLLAHRHAAWFVYLPITVFVCG
jgi:hypothetical protein